MLNQLKLIKIPFSYEIDNKTHSTEMGEFLIDEKPLADWLGIKRDLGNCYTDLDGDKLSIGHFLRKLNGETQGINQFGTDTVTLYRCHCGCDYCGIVSCEIIVTESQFIWQNVGYENDFTNNENDLDDSDKWQLTRLNFTFDKAEYLAEIQQLNINLKKEN